MPGFNIKNNTIWPLQISLNHISPLYFGVIQPGETFKRETGAVWFTVKASILTDESQQITTTDAIIPIGIMVGSIILTAVTAGAAAYAAGPSLAAAGAAGAAGVTSLTTASALATATVASTLVGAGFSAGASLVVGGVVIGGGTAAISAVGTAALKDVFNAENSSVSEPGCFAGDPYPLSISGGPTFRQVPGKDQVELVPGKMKLTVVGMISGATDEELTDYIGSKSYKKNTQTTLLESVRAADDRVMQAKIHYGNGVSVQGMIVNVSGFHFLKRINLESDTGKNWIDDECIEPGNSVNNVNASPFFHTKSDSAAKGCRAGFSYRILDKNSVIQGVISVAWENPLAGGFVWRIQVSKNNDLLRSCLDYCDANTVSKISGDETISTDDETIKKFITIKTFNAATAYLFVNIKTDELVETVLA